jgi:hypothetical protein
MKTKGDGVKAGKAAVKLYGEQISDFQKEKKKAMEELQEIKKEIERTVKNISIGVITSIDENHIRKIGEEFGALHINNVLKQLQKDKEENIAAIANIENDEEYINHEFLINNLTGEYTQKITEESQLFESASSYVKQFDFSQFNWLYKQKDSLNKFTFNIFTAIRRKISIRKTLSQLKKSDIETCISDYEDAQKTMKTHKDELNKWIKKKKQVQKKVLLLEQLKNSVKNFDEETLQKLQEELGKHILNSDFSVLHKMIRKSLHISVAKCDALSKKIQYYENIVSFTDKETADLQRKINSIQSTLYKWERKPYSTLSNDKTKWLVTVPNKKRESNRKKVTHLSTMRTNIYHYNSNDSSISASVSPSSNSPSSPSSNSPSLTYSSSNALSNTV